MSPSDSYEPVAQESDIVPGEPFAASAGGVPVLLARVGDRICAIGRICTHQHADLGEGEIEGGAVICPLHGSAFDLKTGTALNGPAVDPEPVFEVKIEGGMVYVKTK